MMFDNYSAGRQSHLVCAALFVCLWCVPLQAQSTPPSNDNFANRIVLTGPSWTTAPMPLLNATVEPGEPLFQGRPSIWYSWTAPADLMATISTVGSTGTPFVSVAVGNSLSTLYAVVAQGGNLLGGRNPVRFIAVRGVTYQIGVEAVGPDGGLTVLSLTSISFSSGGTIVGPDAPTSPSPANDSFANRKVLPDLPLSFVSYIGSATRETQEPATIARTVWYSYTATSDGFLNVTMDLLSDNQSGVNVFHGDNFAALQLVGTVEQFGPANSISLLMQRGATYHFQAGGNFSTSVMALSFTPASGSATLVGPDKPVARAPANNNFAQRKPLVGSTLRVFNYNSNADKEAFEPVASPNGSVWYSWATDQAGPVTITIGPVGIGQSLGIYTGTSLNTLTAVPLTAVSGSNNRYTFPAVAGTTYQIVNGSSSTGLLSFDLAGPGAGAVGPVPTTRLVNIATRVVVAAGGNLNPGFVISGTGRKTVLVRAIGPGLAAFGVSNTMVDPRVVVFAGTTQIGANDDWSAVPAEAVALRAATTATGAFALPEGSRDAALLLSLEAGTYTALITGAGGGGDTIVEVYEVP